MKTALIAVGKVTSGGFGPSVEGPVAMGYVTVDLSTVGTTLYGEVRGKRHPVEVSCTSFRTRKFQTLNKERIK